MTDQVRGVSYDCPFCQRIATGDYLAEHRPVLPDQETLRVDLDDPMVRAAYEASTAYHFAPLYPVTDGHMLFVPAAHVVPTREPGDVVAASTAVAMEAAAAYAREAGEPYNLITSAGAAATQTVPHLHVHYVPRCEGDGLALPWTGQERAS